MQNDMSMWTLKKTKNYVENQGNQSKLQKKCQEECLKKKGASGNLYKSATENISFFNCEQVFIARKIVKISNIYHYWISKEGEGRVIGKRFLR